MNPTPPNPWKRMTPDERAKGQRCARCGEIIRVGQFYSILNTGLPAHPASKWGRGVGPKVCSRKPPEGSAVA